MPPRPKLRSLAQLADGQLQRSTYICTRCQYATAAAAAAATPAPSDSQILHSSPSLQRYSSVQPPSHRDPKYRKSQLLRSYVSLLQTTPLIVIFQHNNLRAQEWAGIRRELAISLQKVDEQLLGQDPGADPSRAIADSIKLSVIKTNMFEPALRITDFFQPSELPVIPATPQGIKSEREDLSLTHTLSEAAYQATLPSRNRHPLSSLMTGPIALLTFPSVSPQHLKAALSILSPAAPIFPAPTRRARPGFHEPFVQDGLKKLLLLGARVDGQVFDTDGARWVGSIDGGMDGLRAQLVAMLQGFGAGLTTTLESASRSLWFAMEGRRAMLEDEEKPKAETEDGAKPAEAEEQKAAS